MEVRSLIFGMIKGVAAAALEPQPATAAKHPRSFRMAAAMAIVLALAVVSMPTAQAQTYTVLYNFTGGLDGQAPGAGVTMDRSGNLYGTTYYGGTTTNGAAFKLTRTGNSFVFSSLHSFGGDNDGGNPDSKLTIGPDGSLYGTTNVGVPGTGWGGGGSGIVYQLTPLPPICKNSLCSQSKTVWKESVSYQFLGFQDGGYPDSAPIFDDKGNMFGTVPGDICCGVVYELTRSGGTWTKTNLYSFTGMSDGSVPHGGVIRDQAGNLYGVTFKGGANNGGVVYQLVPSGNGWTESVLHSFDPAIDGINPAAGLVFDQAGNLYGTTIDGGPLNGGTVFKLSHAGNTWTSTVIYSFQRTSRGPLPHASLSFDAAGNLYGTTQYGGKSDLGTIFKLTPGVNGWTYKLLKEFDLSDGGLPQSDVVFDASGNLHGTTWKGGTNHLGVVWKITP